MRTQALVALLAAGCTPVVPTSPGRGPTIPGAGDDTAPALDTQDSGRPAPTPLVRITEVHYHPVDESAYADRAEFLELHNGGPGPADLTGWAFTDGVRYTFGSRTLAPGETVVLARDRAALLATFPDLSPDAVVGEWAGSLANGGERVRLVDAAGETVDALRYDDAAPWPVGADALGAQDDFLPAEQLPLADHAGRGRSLQRVQLGADADDPGSWVASPLDGMDPGVWTGDLADGPLATVSALTWGSGAGPLPPDVPVIVTVDVAGALTGARLEWFADDLGRTDEAIETTVLEADADGRLTATLPAFPEGTILRARVLGDTGRGDGPASPRDGDPQAWHGRFVGAAHSGETRAYDLRIDPAQWTAMWDRVAAGRVIDCDENPGWRARVPAVFVVEGAVFDVLVRYQGSRWNRSNGPSISTWPAPGPDRPAPLKSLSWSVKFPRYAPLDGRTRISLNKRTQSCPGLSAAVGMQLFAAAGLPVPRTRDARLFVNGAYYNYVLEIESPGEDMLQRWLEARAAADPELPEEPGVPHLFKSGGCNCDEGPFGWGDERPLTDFCGWTAAQRYAATYERKTWTWAGHADLQALIEGLDAARGADDATLRAFLDARFDVDAVLAYMAVINWAVPFDDMFQNHYLVQRRSDGRWLMAPWDLDQDFGGWKGAEASIYLGEEGDPDNRSGWSNRIKDAFLRVYRAEYEETLGALNETVLHPDAVIPLVDAAEASWDLAEVSASAAGPQCSFPGGAQDFRDFARERHDVVAAALAR
jgi:hypothetical protein